MPNVLAPSSLIPQQHLAPPAAAVQRAQRVAVVCGTSKGFGDNTTSRPAKSSKAKSKPKKQVAKISSEQAVERAVRIAEGGATRPVSGGEAAKGRLDYVQVKDWGTGKPGDLGSLEVDSVRTVTGDPLAAESDRPFYEQLARHLEICQARGDLDPPPGSKPLPPFEKWAFKKRHFLQYLTDLVQVHHALEAATLASLQPYRDGLPEDKEKDDESPDSWVDPEVLTGAYGTRACAALGCFSEGSGLWRAGPIMRDLHAIAAHTAGNMPFELEASDHATDYADDLMATASVAQEAEAGAAVQDEARLRLLAHIYSNQVAHLTTGMRIGAAAAERLDLFAIGATGLYQAYPEDMDDPLHTFMGLINGIGTGLSAEEKRYVMDEVPTAFYKVSQLLAAMARTE